MSALTPPKRPPPSPPLAPESDDPAPSRRPELASQLTLTSSTSPTSRRHVELTKAPAGSMFSPFYPLVRPPMPAPPTSVVHSASQALTPGTVISGRYRVERFIGRGAMGAVYAVHHLNTGESLALKVLHPVLASNTQAVERFRIEARAPVRIGTENVVRIIDADLSAELGGVPFLVMELLAGRDLDSELARRGALPPGDVVLYLQQVARALDRAHALGIIHRDLKPANLYLTSRDDGSPLMKILDFGIAKLADGVPRDMTQDGAIFGTPWYMSPEQARGRAATVFPSADLWALGLITYRLLTGRNYWTADAMASLIGQIVSEPMPPPSQMAPQLGPAFDAWFARACNREPEARFGTATEQVAKLAEALSVPFAETSLMAFGPPPSHPFTSGGGAPASAPNPAAPSSISFGAPPSASVARTSALPEARHTAAPISTSVPPSRPLADASASANMTSPSSQPGSRPGSTSSLIAPRSASVPVARPSSALSVAFGVLVAVATVGIATTILSFVHGGPSLGAQRPSAEALPASAPEAPSRAEPASAAPRAHPDETRAAVAPAQPAPADLAPPSPSAATAPAQPASVAGATVPAPRPLPGPLRPRAKPPAPASTNPQAKSAPKVGKIRF